MVPQYFIKKTFLKENDINMFVHMHAEDVFFKVYNEKVQKERI